MNLHAMALYAQAVPDFSGSRVQDTIKSDDSYRNFNVKLNIIQGKGVNNVKPTFSDKIRKELVTRESTFNPDVRKH